MALPVLTRGAQKLGENKETPDEGGQLDLCQGGPGVDPGLEDGHGHPPRAKTPGSNYPSGHTGDPTPDGREGS